LTAAATGQPGGADFVPLVIRPDYCLQSYYYNQALGSVDIRVVMNGVETSTPIRHYQLTYGNGIPLELASIQETGSDGQSTLPGVTLHWSLFQEAYDPSGCTPYAQPYPGTNPTFC